MAPRFGDQILQVFDVPADAYEFLVGIVEDRHVSPHDFKAIFDQSLTAGAESWYHDVDCAWNHGSNIQTPSATQKNARPSETAWEETDRLIKRAESLAKEAVSSLSLDPCLFRYPKKTKVTKAAKRKVDAVSSHYWCQSGETDDGFSTPKRFRATEFPSTFISRLNIPAPGRRPSCVYPKDPGKTQLPSVHANAGTSPYFSTPSRAPRSANPRPSPGTVSCIPFPPLSAGSFGIIQEQVAHEPFWLLIVVTFLIKTKGDYAIPAFLRLRERFPTPRDVADPDNAAEIVAMIRHLGLSQNRLAKMQKYARMFMFHPPRPGVCYAVRGYETRKVGRVVDGVDATDGWEIGHMTQGPYSLDSWRIFCRDVLLGRAKDYNGKGARGEFQPEWMRVLPADKELRAYLRWMWMREGWEWDPATGERTVLREEMRRAVEEGRVEYDIYGGLQIVGNDEAVG
ncbi:pre-mRNA splicing factor [Cordyceps militaris CM01]|uniref:Pre-mRNA splicing factor n=1 Tax=Cordyceps militaris (strain CM01) TaxID=983644 RepID=G3JJR7_CORMM|nr:pre-mRNA splicing factor [Cordyceps militaris CM01]EGX92101.1 pre-mRNA splicing factor [Cordyceps militaris CM01]